MEWDRVREWKRGDIVGAIPYPNLGNAGRGLTIMRGSPIIISNLIVPTNFKQIPSRVLHKMRDKMA